MLKKLPQNNVHQYYLANLSFSLSCSVLCDKEETKSKNDISAKFFQTCDNLV